MQPPLNKDIVIAGAVLHDIGKLLEYDLKPHGADYSASGQLVGHVAQGLLSLERKIQECKAGGQDISPRLHLVLQHIILSHHGQPEYGALKVPSTPEAIAVSLLDNLDAKLHMALTAGRGEKPGAEVLICTCTLVMSGTASILSRPKL